jgi:hypothetical protein
MATYNGFFTEAIIALIGRDVFSLGILVYNGSLGTFSFST